MFIQSVSKVDLATIIYTKISEVNFSAFLYKLFLEDFSSIIGTNTCI